MDPGWAYAPGQSIAQQTRQAVDEVRKFELDADFADALARYLATIPPPGAAPGIDEIGAGLGIAQRGQPPQNQGTH